MASDRIFTYRENVVVPFAYEVSPGKKVDFTPVIEHAAFSRLKYVGQLAPIDLVIPGTGHKRYEHCLGVFDLSQQVISRSELNLSDYEKFLMLSVALLHDVGHGPYSHVYEIVASSYGLPNHKEHGLKIIEEEMGDVLRMAGNSHFNYNHITEDLVRLMRTKHPIARLVLDKDRLDKWDYTIRDRHYAQCGSRPDIETLITNLYFDGKKSGIKHTGRDALRAYLEALINNNSGVYIRQDVETIEGFLIRAILAAKEDDTIDLDRAYGYDDEKLNSKLMQNGRSAEIFKSIRSNTFREGSRWLPVASIKPRGYGWIAKADENTSLVEEINETEMKKFNEGLKLPEIIKLEKSIMKELELKPDELVITFSPQIDRLVIDNSNIVYPSNGELVFTSIFDISPSLGDYLKGRLEEHYAIRAVSTREKKPNVTEYLERRGGFKEVLKDIL